MEPRHHHSGLLGTVEDAAHRLAHSETIAHVVPIAPELMQASKVVFWSETWRLALQALRANKVRAGLTMLGVIIGSACIVLVVTVALAGKTYIIKLIEGVGANLVFVDHPHIGREQNSALADEISLDDTQAIREEASNVAYVAATRNIPLTVVAGGVEYPVNLVGVTEGFQEIRRLIVLRGRYFEPDDMMSRSKVCLLTEELAKVVFAGDDAVGQDIRVGNLHFTVIGVFKERVSTFGESEITDKSVIVPFGLIKYYTGTDFVSTLYAQAQSPGDVQQVAEEVGEILHSRHRPGAEYRVQNLASLRDSAEKISFALTIVLLLIAFIALLISGIGIMNIMLVTVTERTREIGIRMAVGARRSHILSQFLMEAVIISGCGALLGIGIGVLVPVLSRSLLALLPVPGPIQIPISWLSVLAAFVVSCGTGLVFGYLPANRAASLHPTDSLRYE
jgi:putative ABC transport system permease protein